MNKLLIGAIILLALTTITLFRFNLNNKANAIKWEQNYEALKVNNAEQIQYSTAQFKEYEFKLDSLAKVLGIKSKQIKTVIVTKYSIDYDTFVQTKLIYDTTLNHFDFSFNEPNNCYLIEGNAKGNIEQINLTNVVNNDIITTYLYDSRGYFFFNLIPKFWQKHLITAKVYSECKNDTISISKNILIK